MTNYIAGVRRLLWGDTLKRIEGMRKLNIALNTLTLNLYLSGRFGTSVSSYFEFLIWLFQLNFLIFLLIFCAIILPHIIYEPKRFELTKRTRFEIDAKNCTNNYNHVLGDLLTNASTFSKALGIFTGTVRTF